MSPFSLPPWHAPGIRLTYLLSSYCRPERASLRRARLVWLGIAGLILMSIVATLASTATVRNDSEQQSTAEFTGPSFVQQDVSDGDPKPDPQHRESPAKKPRVKSLLVETASPSDPAMPMAFHLRLVNAAPMLHVAPGRIESPLGTRRSDPVLRLHPGQAPPRIV
jgi:hypothetical protein